MTMQEVKSPGRDGSRSAERTSILVLAALVIGGVGFFLLFRPAGGRSDDQRNLLPYQALVRTLAASDQPVYAALRRGLANLEAERAATRRWPDPAALAAQGVPPFADSSADGLSWQKFQQRATVNYLGLPADPSGPAWLLAIQEPEPNQPPDPAPTDDEHHRLPDGTTLHIYVWMHRLGGQLPPAFVAQPSTGGWTEIFATPPNPIPPPR